MSLEQRKMLFAKMELNLGISCPDAHHWSSHSDSMVSKTHYKVYLRHILHTARISEL